MAGKQTITIVVDEAGAINMRSPEGMPPAEIIGILAIAQALVTSRLVKPAPPGPGIMLPQGLPAVLPNGIRG